MKDSLHVLWVLSELVVKIAGIRRSIVLFQQVCKYRQAVVTQLIHDHRSIGLRSEVSAFDRIPVQTPTLAVGLRDTPPVQQD